MLLDPLSPYTIYTTIFTTFWRRPKRVVLIQYLCLYIIRISLLNMENEQDRNVLFVQQIEQHPCLYDITSPFYTRTDRKEKAWENIAKQSNDYVAV